MRQTHKFRGLKDVADIVANAPSVAAAAKQLGVQRSTIHRWVEAGKLPRPGGRDPAAVNEVIMDGQAQDPNEWSESVKKDYTLSQTDLVLLDLAVRALQLARDGREQAQARLGAMARFQLLVRQLNLSQPIVPEKSEPKRMLAPRSIGDPRAALMAV